MFIILFISNNLHKQKTPIKSFGDIYKIMDSLLINFKNFLGLKNAVKDMKNGCKIPRKIPFDTEGLHFFGKLNGVYSGFVKVREGSTVICFRSAYTFRDWLTCFDFFKRSCSFLGDEYVHGGFLKRFETSVPDLSKVFSKVHLEGNEISIEGYSMGGPLAVFAYFYFAKQGLNIDRVTTVNSPFFLSKSALEYAKRHFNEGVVLRIFRQNDTVSNSGKIRFKKIWNPFIIFIKLFTKVFKRFFRLFGMKYFGTKYKVLESEGLFPASHRKLVEPDEYLRLKEIKNNHFGSWDQDKTVKNSKSLGVLA